MGTAPVVELRGVTVVQDGATLVEDVDLAIRERRHTVLLGPNGAGKTTLLRVVTGFRHPTRGSARILGQDLGRTDVRELRRRVGFTSTALHPLLQTSAPVEVVIAAALHGATARVRALVEDPAAFDRAEAALAQVGGARLVGRRCDTLSQGEWQRIQIARALVTRPDLLLLDEPMAGLDIAGRESLLADLDALMSAPDGPTVLLVVHHLEEIPPATSDAVLLGGGHVVAAGPIDETLTSAALSDAFGLPLAVTRDRGRWRAIMADGGRSGSEAGEGRE